MLRDTDGERDDAAARGGGAMRCDAMGYLYAVVVRAWGSGASPGFVALLAFGTGTVEAGRSDSQWVAGG
jgi:hypothetical protein